MKVRWIKGICGGLVFVLVGIFILNLLTKACIPTEDDAFAQARDMVRGIYKLEDESVDVVFGGVSFMAMGVSPMEIYESHGLLTYNMSSAGQPIGVSYHLLKEFYKKQTPQVVVLDVSSLFYAQEENAWWRYVIDGMPFSLNKIELGMDYATKTYKGNTPSDGFLSVLFPIYKYHSNWQSVRDIRFDTLDKGNCMLGYKPDAAINPAYLTVEQMNQEGAYYSWISQQENVVVQTEDDSTDKSMNEREEMMQMTISEENQEYLRKIKALCDENGSRLLLTKVPVLGFPQIQPMAWTENRSAIMKQFALENGYEFVDLLYDNVNLNIDWATDTLDCGGHLNLYGARKLSDFFGEYLKVNYGLESKTNPVYDVALQSYKKCEAYIEIQSKQEMCDYFDALKKQDDIIILIAGSDDLSSGLTEDYKKALCELGLGTVSFEDMFRKSYVAIVDDGQVKYEAKSDELLSYEYDFDGLNRCKITSAGFNPKVEASIQYNGVEFSFESIGLSIVVIDKESMKVIDNVNFDISTQANAMRDEEDIKFYFSAYQRYAERAMQ